MAQTKVQLLQPDLGDVIDFDASTLFVDGADNRIGIRNTNPQYELDVTGTINATNFRGNISTGTIDDWITHTGDTDTKIGFPAADQFQVFAGGGPRLTVTSTGLGIGESTPSSLLHLKRSSTTAYSSTATNNDNTLMLINEGAAGHTSIQFQTVSGGTANTGQANINVFCEGNSAKNTAIAFGTRGASGNPAERLRITSTGRVNIGHLNQTGSQLDYTRLNVYGQTSAGGTNKNLNLLNVYNYGDGNVGNITGIGLGAGASPGSYTKASIGFIRTGTYGRGDLIFCINDQGNGNPVVEGNERLRITSAGHLQLQGGTVYGDDAATATFKLQSTSGNSNHARIEIGAIQSSDNGGIHFYTAGSSAATRYMTLKGGGNLGIGVDNPVGNLEIRDANKTNLIVAKVGLPVKANSDLATSYDMIQLGAGGALASYSATSVTADTMFIHNAYRHSGNDWKRRYADTAARMRVNSPANTWIFETAATGSADSTITSWDESLRIASNGLVTIKGNSGNAAHTHLKLINTDSTSSGETGQTNDIEFFFTDNVGNSYKGAQISAYKTADWVGNPDYDAGLKFYTVDNESSFGNAYAERLRIASDGEVFMGTSHHGTTDRSTLLSISGAYQDPAGSWTQMGLYSNDSHAAGKGGSIGFGGQDGSTTKQQFAAIKGAKENGTSGNYAGYMALYTRPYNAVTKERLRIESNGDVAINTTDGDFGQSNSGSDFAKGDPKLGVHGSIAIMNTSSTVTDYSELAFYRRTKATPQGDGSHRITSTSNIGRISWYGSSNDTSFPDRVWSIEAVANGADWWAGSGRRAKLSFKNQDAEQFVISSGGDTAVKSGKFSVESQTNAMPYQVLSGYKTFSASDTFVGLAYVGHSHSIQIQYMIVENDNTGLGGAHGTVNFFTTYGSSSGPQNHSFRRYAMNGGRVNSDPTFYYCNGSCGSHGGNYVIQCKIGYSGSAHNFTIRYVITGLSVDANAYV